MFGDWEKLKIDPAALAVDWADAPGPDEKAPGRVYDETVPIGQRAIALCGCAVRRLPDSHGILAGHTCRTCPGWPMWAIEKHCGKKTDASSRECEFTTEEFAAGQGHLVYSVLPIDPLVDALAEVFEPND